MTITTAGVGDGAPSIDRGSIRHPLSEGRRRPARAARWRRIACGVVLGHPDDPSSETIVSKHPPIGPDLCALDLYDQDVVKIKAELPEFGDHHQRASVSRSAAISAYFFPSNAGRS
jgi:hypothetical protein